MVGAASCTRRPRLLGALVAGMAPAISAACGEKIKTSPWMAREPKENETADKGRLLARPRQAAVAGPLGLQPLGLGGERDGLIYVPAGYGADQPLPLVLMLHGAGGHARHALDPLLELADDHGLLLLAPDSRGRTWDLLLRGYGPDITFIDRVLAHTFSHYSVDSAHIAAEGFSDGASYALSLAITNGDLFSHCIAFSPGFAAPAAQRGLPRLFISHGTRDEVLPIDTCSRRIVPRLERAGYDVQYREFDGPHTVPPEIVRDALTWFGEKRG